ncbi:MAG: PilZ domain-containing protein [Deltaproteobacteria bacterium]|jgi:hypothetical protein|nr:PilZ domain-containing protein [Deltaproteobacteria bacterium]
MSQSKDGGADKRRYSRTAVYFQGQFRYLSSAQEPQLCPRQVNSENASLITQMASDPKVSAGMARFLGNLDAKLDSILSLLQRDSLDEFFPNRLMVIELSAAGVLVQSPDLQVDDFIELVMHLGDSPPKVVSAAGQVLRPRKTSFQSEGLYAVNFTSIRDSDREEIVRFVFQEEREKIRSRKLK